MKNAMHGRPWTGPWWLTVVTLFLTGVLGVAACSDSSITLRPCKRDFDCKLDRICDQEIQACVYPLTRSPTDPDASSGPSTSVSNSASSTSGVGGSAPSCEDPSDCPGSDSDCKKRVCVSGVCDTQNAVIDAPCDDNGGDSCNGQGECIRTEFWSKLPTNQAPSDRYGHTAVWTGTEMLIWGGRQDGGTVLADGARYNPLSDTWAPMNTSGAPSARYAHTAIWTGTEMVVWGGFSTDFEQSGARYKPATDTWSPMATSGAPSKRMDHTMVWTGTQVLIWGGRRASQPALGDGARYNPSNNTWTGISDQGKPSRRWAHSAVWTGDRMLVWGGFNFFDWFNNGAHYDPVSNTWLAMGSTGALPGIRMATRAVWTGDRMLLWGGWDGGYYQNDGGQFQTSAGMSGTWLALDGTPAPSGRAYHVALWTGSSGFFVWGGCGTDTCLQHYDDGGIWKQNAWTPIESDAELSARRDHSGIYTGSEVIIWGGRNTTSDAVFGNGARRLVN